MSEYQPKEGDRVRVVIEGPVFHVDKLHRFADIGDLGRRYTVPLLGEAVVVSVEKLPDPEPEWQKGDVVRDAKGDLWNYPAFGDVWPLVFTYSGRALTSASTSSGRPGKYDEDMVRPLTLLVRDGKVVG